MTQPERSFVPARLRTKAVAKRAPDNEFVSQEAHTGRVTTTIRGKDYLLASRTKGSRNRAISSCSMGALLRARLPNG
jgi:hypothetical protein